MLASQVPTSMGNMVLTPLCSQVGMRRSMRPSQSSEMMWMPWALAREVIFLYHGPISSSNTAGITSGPFLKQMSSQKWP